MGCSSTNQPCATFTGRAKYSHALSHLPSLLGLPTTVAGQCDKVSSYFILIYYPPILPSERPRAFLGGTGMAEEASHETNLDGSGANGWQFDEAQKKTTGAGKYNGIPSIIVLWDCTE